MSLLCHYCVNVYKGYVPPATLISANRTIHTIDFSAVTVEELQNFDIDFVFKIDKTCEPFLNSLCQMRGVDLPVVLPAGFYACPHIFVNFQV